MKGGPSAHRLPTRGDVDSAAGSAVEVDRHLKKLAVAASAGDRNAIDLILYAVDSQRLAEPGVRRVLFEPDDIDEVLQDVLIVVAEQIGRFRHESRFTTWLYGIARNKALEFLRRKRSSAELRTELGDSARISSLIATEVTVERLVSALPEIYRRAVTMRDLEGMAYADIARALDLNLNTVRSHISRGRGLVAAAVAESGL